MMKKDTKLGSKKTIALKASFLTSLGLYLVFQFTSVSVWGAEATTAPPQVVAVQERPFSLSREASVHFSYMPMDHFLTYYSVGAGYTHYFKDYLGWEIIDLSYTRSSSTGLRTALEDKFGVSPETSDEIQWLGTSNVVYTPLYMKHLYAGEKIIWGDLSLLGGAGIAKLARNGNTTVFDAGLMMRFYADKKWIYRFDLRQYFFAPAAAKPNLAISLAISYNLGSGK